MNIYKQTEYKGFHINIYTDEDAESPRQAFDNLGTLYTAHRRYRPEEDFDSHFSIDGVFEGHIGKFRKAFLQQYVALPVYLFDHTGLSVSTSPFNDPWDSGFFGIIAVKVSKVKKEFGWKRLTHDRRKRIEEYLEGEIKTYDLYLSGEVYGFQITPSSDDEEVLESMWGYYGEDSIPQIEDECQCIIDQVYALKPTSK